MSGNSSGQVLGAVTGTAGVVILPNTGNSILLQFLTYTLIVSGIVVALSFTASRVYRKSIK
jgi:hypothetical protein